MPDQIRPSPALLQQTGRILVHERDWQNKIAVWLLPIYFSVTDDDIAAIGMYRKRYSLPSWRAGRYQPMINRTKHPRKIGKRFDRLGGDLYSLARKIRKIKQEKIQ